MSICLYRLDCFTHGLYALLLALLFALKPFYFLWARMPRSWPFFLPLYLFIFPIASFSSSWHVCILSSVCLSLGLHVLRLDYREQRETVIMTDTGLSPYIRIYIVVTPPPPPPTLESLTWNHCYSVYS